eukprot:1062519_1
MWTTLATLALDTNRWLFGGSELTPSSPNTYITCHHGEVWEYNIDSNQFTAIASYKRFLHDRIRRWECSYAYNYPQRKLYLYISAQDLEAYGNYVTCIIINNSLHLIGGTNNNKHLKWDDDQHQFVQIQEFRDFSGCCRSQDAIYLKSKKMLLLFEDKFDRLYTYDIVKHKWNKLPVSSRLPVYTRHFGTTTVLNDQYVLLFGGLGCGVNFNTDIDTIWIFDVSTQTYRKSKIKCPIKSVFEACTVTDNKRNELVVFGFVRDITKHRLPPIYLIKLVQSWYWAGVIFLMDSKSGKHWKINTFDLL